MNEKQNKKISKLLSLVLSHRPETIELNLDEHGWADVDELLKKMANHNRKITLNELRYVVENNDTPSMTSKQKSAPIKDTPLIFNLICHHNLHPKHSITAQLRAFSVPFSKKVSSKENANMFIFLLI